MKKFLITIFLFSSAFGQDNQANTSSASQSIYEIELDLNLPLPKADNKQFSLFYTAAEAILNQDNLCSTLLNNDIPDEIKDTLATLWWQKNKYKLFKNTKTFTGHNNTVTSAIQLNDGNILTTSWDKTAKIWDPNTGEVIHTLTVHNNWVTSTIQLNDGNVLTTSDHNTARIWNPNTGEVIHTLTVHNNWVTSAIQLNDGNILTTSWDNTARIWGPDPKLTQQDKESKFYGKLTNVSLCEFLAEEKLKNLFQKKIKIIANA